MTTTIAVKESTVQLLTKLLNAKVVTGDEHFRDLDLNFCVLLIKRGTRYINPYSRFYS